MFPLASTQVQNLPTASQSDIEKAEKRGELHHQSIPLPSRTEIDPDLEYGKEQPLGVTQSTAPSLSRPSAKRAAFSDLDKDDVTAKCPRTQAHSRTETKDGSEGNTPSPTTLPNSAPSGGVPKQATGYREAALTRDQVERLQQISQSDGIEAAFGARAAMFEASRASRFSKGNGWTTNHATWNGLAEGYLLEFAEVEPMRSNSIPPGHKDRADHPLTVISAKDYCHVLIAIGEQNLYFLVITSHQGNGLENIPEHDRYGFVSIMNYDDDTVHAVSPLGTLFAKSNYPLKQGSCVDLKKVYCVPLSHPVHYRGQLIGESLQYLALLRLRAQEMETSRLGQLGQDAADRKPDESTDLQKLEKARQQANVQMDQFFSENGIYGQSKGKGTDSKPKNLPNKTGDEGQGVLGPLWRKKYPYLPSTSVKTSLMECVRSNLTLNSQPARGGQAASSPQLPITVSQRPEAVNNTPYNAAKMPSTGGANSAIRQSGRKSSDNSFANRGYRGPQRYGEFDRPRRDPRKVGRGPAINNRTYEDEVARENRWNRGQARR